MPELQSCNLAADPTTLPTPAAAFAATYAMALSAHDRVAQEYTSLDGIKYHYVTGHKRTYFRPKYAVERKFPALSTPYADPSVSQCINPSQRALAMAIQHDRYLEWRSDISAFDQLHPNSIPSRESRRTISAAQPIADKWLSITPDPTVKHSLLRSKLSIMSVQRRHGLYLSAATALFDTMEAVGTAVTPNDRLGDTMLNKHSTTARHNEYNRAWYNAINARARRHLSCHTRRQGRRLPSGTR